MIFDITYTYLSFQKACVHFVKKHSGFAFINKLKKKAAFIYKFCEILDC